MEISSEQLAGLAEIDWGKISANVSDVIKQAAPALLSAKQQRDLQKLNLQRAKQGLPPLDTAAYAEASAPVVKVQGGVDPGTRKILWGVGLGLLSLGAVLVFRRPRRA